MNTATNRARVLVAGQHAGIGIPNLFVRPAVISAVPPDVINGQLQSVKASGTTLENGYLRVKVALQTGCITSLYDLRNQTEALAPSETDTGGPKTSACGNLLQAFYDSFQGARAAAANP